MMCLVTSVADGRILNASLRHVVFQTACSWQGGADVVRMKLWLAQRQTAKVLSEHVVLVFRFRMFSRGPLATSGRCGKLKIALIVTYFCCFSSWMRLES